MKDKYANETQSGFEFYDKPNVCKHPEHEAPTHMVVPSGKQYKNVCPACGHTTFIRPSEFSLTDCNPAMPPNCS